MHLAHAEIFDVAGSRADRHVAPPAARTMVAATLWEPDGRYGDSRRPSLPVLAAIALLHVLAIVALVKLDVIQVAKPHQAMKVFDIQEAPPPPPEAAPPPPEPKVVPPVAVPVVAPPPIVTTAMPPPSPVQAVKEAPPPVMAPVAVPQPPVAAPAPGALVSDTLSIVSKDPLPRYPMESRRKHEEGVVRLRVTVDPAGAVKDIAVAATSGFRRLDEAALEAVRRWRFKPKVRDGVAVEAFGFIPIPFHVR